MKLVGFDFKKISIEKFKSNPETIKFNTKIDISSLEELKSDIFRSRETLIKVEFTYLVLYEPEFAKLELSGNILLAVEPKVAREVLKGWKDKQMVGDFRIAMFNIILRKSNIKALQLEDELGLPPHFTLPSVNKESLQEKK